MEELISLIERTQAGDLDAFGTIVTRFQDMAVGYAYSILGDLHLAEDAAQEAFIQAYRDLDKLRELVSFPGWFRKIVFKYCDRFIRKRVETIPLEAAVEMPSLGKSPAEAVLEQEMKDVVLAAIQALPEKERIVTTLFYIDGYSQNEIANFLEVPVTTVNSRLHYSRKRLKERLSTMVKDDLQEKRPSKDERFASKVKEALREIEGYRSEAKFHQGAISDIASLVPEASHNISVITRTAYLASKFGYHTVPLMDIAKMAAMLDHECEELYELAELSVLKLSGTPRVVELAELAAKAQSEEEKQHIREEIENLKATADYPNIEEALEGNEREKRERKIAPIPEDVDAEALKQRAHDFLEALVDKNFEKAYTVAGTRGYEWVEQHDAYSNVEKIITVGEPFRWSDRYAGGKGVHIPFEIELADGKIRKALINIRWDNPEGEWRFDGGL